MSEKKFDPRSQLSERNLAWALRLYDEIGKKPPIKLSLRDNAATAGMPVHITDVKPNGMVKFVYDNTKPTKNYEVHVSDVICITY